MEPEEVLEQEPVVEEPTISEMENIEESAVETPAEEPVVESEPQPAPEPMQIYTKGKWVLLEKFLPQEMENGKTYHINVFGHCQFMISADKPTVGISTNEIAYTKQEGQNLWIKTGE